MAAQVISPPLVIPNAAFPYAVAQSGAIDHFKGDPHLFAANFDWLQRQRLASIKPYLPATCERFLDVGGGVGGMATLIARHYGPGSSAWILDGVANPPLVERHDLTFNDMQVSEAFMAANGVELDGFYPPSAGGSRPQERYRRTMGFDLVVSFAAWGFHITPGVYLRLVSGSTRDGAAIIVDVRRDKPAWRTEFERYFNFIAVVEEGTKYDRCVYQRP